MWKPKPTLSIQSYFPDRNSTATPSSTSSTFSSHAATKMNYEASKGSCLQDIRVDEGPSEKENVSIGVPQNNSASMVVPPLIGQPILPLPVTGKAEAIAASRPLPVPLPLPPRSPSFGNKSSIKLGVYVPLYQAALKGDWEKAQFFIDLHPSALSARITRGGETVLHIAAGAKQTKFVEELVELMNDGDLELQNRDGNTALCFAAASGNKRIAEIMVTKNKNLPAVRGSKGVTALHLAALLGHRDIVWFLFSVTKDEDLKKDDYIGLLIAAVSSDLYDVALHILDRQPQLAIEQDLDGETALHVLAQKPLAVSSKSGLRNLQRLIYPWTRKFHEAKLQDMQYMEVVKRVWGQVVELLDDRQIGNLLKSTSQPLFIAAELGNFEFVNELVHSYPDLIWKVDEKSRSIFHIAVIHRQEKIFRLIYEIGAHKDLIAAYKDTNNTNILHLAGKLPPSNRLNIVSGAALQMQRELLWFKKEVEKNVRPSYKEMRDMEGRTPRMLFSEEHKGLVKAGERWMKDTASSCMLVATLITTVMFAAIFTVPGGNNNDTGTPIFLHSKSFLMFAVSDAFALFSSVTAILMFLSILTLRYAEEDFLESLPKRLIIGLSTLFFSIASMLIAFSATFFIVLEHHLAWVVIPVALVACIPVTLFALLQFPLLGDMIYSTYGSGIFVKPCRDMLH